MRRCLLKKSCYLIFNCIVFVSYIPTILWGKSGHIQTFLYGKMGRFNSPVPHGERHFETMEDGATMSYDIYQPTVKHSSGGLLLIQTIIFCTFPDEVA